jgi:hypothetical protein
MDSVGIEVSDICLTAPKVQETERPVLWSIRIMVVEVIGVTPASGRFHVVKHVMFKLNSTNHVLHNSS